MEYEIEAEVILFDASTNPSLDRTPSHRFRDLRPLQKRRPQRAEVIPEEEEQAA